AKRSYGALVGLGERSKVSPTSAPRQAARLRRSESLANRSRKELHAWCHWLRLLVDGHGLTIRGAFHLVPRAEVDGVGDEDHAAIAHGAQHAAGVGAAGAGLTVVAVPATHLLLRQVGAAADVVRAAAGVVGA